MVVSHKFNGVNLDALNERFLEAVAQKNVEQARIYVDRGANINVRFANEDTALLHAARTGDSSMALMLIEKKASLDAQDAEGATALIVSIKAKNLPLSRALLDANADISIEDRDGMIAFDHALQRRDREFVELFEKPMMRILDRIPCSELAQKLRDSRKDLDSIEPVTGDTMLTFAASRLDQQCVAQAFIEAGADPNKKNRAGKTPLEVAKETGNSAMQRLLEEAQKKPPLAAEQRAPLKPFFPSTST